MDGVFPIIKFRVVYFRSKYLNQESSVTTECLKCRIRSSIRVQNSPTIIIIVFSLLKFNE